MKSYKNKILLSLILLSQLHAFFRGIDINVSWYFVDKVRSLNFSVFMTCVFVRFTLIYYLLLRPIGISKTLKQYLFILSFFDLVWWVLFSGVGYEIEKLFSSLLVLGVIKFIDYVKFRYTII